MALDDNEEWSQIAVVEDSLACTYKPTNNGVSYRFRVRAVNVHGPSPPSKESDKVTIGDCVDSK